MKLQNIGYLHIYPPITLTSPARMSVSVTTTLFMTYLVATSVSKPGLSYRFFPITGSNVCGFLSPTEKCYPAL
jgi:hypothetical protein